MGDGNQVPLTPEFEVPVEAWEGYNFLRKVEVTIKAGPRYKLEKYLGGIELLLEAKVRFQQYNCPDGADQSRALLDYAMDSLAVEFGDVLQKLSDDAATSLSPERLRAVENRIHVDLRQSGDSLFPSPATSPGGSLDGLLFQTSSPFSLRESRGVDMLPVIQLSWLKKMVKYMTMGGASSKCAVTYRKVRAGALRRCLDDLQLREISVAEFTELSWKDMERTLKSWIQDFDLLVRVLLTGEQQLCNEVLLEIPSIERERCFADILRSGKGAEYLSLLMRTAKHLTQINRAPEHLFALLDMSNILYEDEQEVNKLFESPAFTLLLDEYKDLQSNLAMAVIATFREFRHILEDVQHSDESAPLRSWIFKGRQMQPGDDVPAGGGILPVTSYVVQYVRGYLHRHGQRNYLTMLERIFRENAGASPEEDGNRPKLEHETGNLIKALRQNLDNKARKCKDEALANLFLMNNSQYIFMYLRDNRDMLMAVAELQDDRFVQFYYKKFCSAFLLKVLAPMKNEVQSIKGRKIFGKADQDPVSRVKRFNAAFDELQARQKQWEVPDTELREKLCQTLSFSITGPYQSFLESFPEIMENPKVYSYNIHAVEDIVEQFFRKP